MGCVAWKHFESLREAVADFFQSGLIAQGHLIVFVAVDAEAVLQAGADVVGHVAGAGFDRFGVKSVLQVVGAAGGVNYI
jgi:tetrahydromethanopterin S-methyltransferase subunit A